MTSSAGAGGPGGPASPGDDEAGPEARPARGDRGWGGVPPEAPTRTLEILRALGNPVRMRIVRAMALGNPMRVSDVAAAVGEPANSVSYHLRQLAGAGVVRRVHPEGATDGRETWWSAEDWNGLVVEPSEIADQPGGGPALRAMSALMSSEAAQLFSMERITSSEELGWPGIVANGVLRLTRAEADELTEALGHLMESARATSRAHARAGDEDTHDYDYRLAVLATPGTGTGTTPPDTTPPGD